MRLAYSIAKVEFILFWYGIIRSLSDRLLDASGRLLEIAENELKEREAWIRSRPS